MRARADSPIGLRLAVLLAAALLGASCAREGPAPLPTEGLCPDGSSAPCTAGPACGDGRIDPGEACDDGFRNSDFLANACRTSCALPSCGDGVLDVGEGCDDGNLSLTDACLAGPGQPCQPAVCGDGILRTDITDPSWPGYEACDDGTGRDDDACLDGASGACRVAVCGDGVLRTDLLDPVAIGYEACDEGPANSDLLPDACRLSCRPAGCGDGVDDPSDDCDLAVRHNNRLPTRLAEGPQGELYVTDASVGSLFFYDADLALVGELEGLDSPLGVAVGADGRIYVGSDGRDALDIYSSRGEHLATAGEGDLLKPNDIALDETGRLYVADSQANTVRVYDAEGEWQQDIGEPGPAVEQLSFPAAVAISRSSGPQQVFVADQGSAQVKVFSLDGSFVRAFGGRAENSDTQGRFVRLQSLGFDDEGLLHASDAYTNTVQILDPADGAFIGSYGGFGRAPGQLYLPLDVHPTSGGRVIVANARNHRLELFP